MTEELVCNIRVYIAKSEHNFESRQQNIFNINRLDVDEIQES